MTILSDRDIWCCDMSNAIFAGVSSKMCCHMIWEWQRWQCDAHSMDWSSMNACMLGHWRKIEMWQLEAIRSVLFKGWSFGHLTDEDVTDRLSGVRSLALPDLGPDRTHRQVRGSGPEIAGPELCWGVQVQLPVGPDLGGQTWTGPGPIVNAKSICSNVSVWGKCYIYPDDNIHKWMSHVWPWHFDASPSHFDHMTLSTPSCYDPFSFSYLLILSCLSCLLILSDIDHHLSWTRHLIRHWYHIPILSHNCWHATTLHLPWFHCAAIDMHLPCAVHAFASRPLHSHLHVITLRCTCLDHVLDMLLPWVLLLIYLATW